MGEKGGWLSAFKKAFSPHSKPKLINSSSDKRIPKEKKNKKKGFARFRPLFREPSSIEKILDEAEREHNLIFRPPPTSDPTKTTYISPKSPPKSVSNEKITSSMSIPLPLSPSPAIASARKLAAAEIEPVPAKNTGSAIPLSPQDSAIKIQSLYRGYKARKHFRIQKGAIRLRRDMIGPSVQRQTSNALKTMQLMVKLQTQIQFRRTQMVDVHSRLDTHMRETESSFGKWSHASEAGNVGWNDSLLTRDQVEARLRRKADGIAKRERAMAYSYSNQKTKAMKVNRVPSWLKWIERPIEVPAEREDAPTPRSTKSAATFAPGNDSKASGKLRSRARGGVSPKDDDSLISCPPFNANRHYMSPTASTVAKARANSNASETPTSDMRRLSFPFIQGIVNSSPRPNSVGSSDGNGRKPFNRFV